MRARSTLVLLLSVGSIGVAGRASAQTTPSGAGASSASGSASSASPIVPTGVPGAPAKSLSDSLTGEAKTNYEAGKVYFNDKDYDRAYLKFQSAYDKSKDPRLLWNMAACRKEQRTYAKVIPLVEQYMRERSTALTPAERSAAEALLAAIRPGVTTVRVDVNEPDAEIYLDDEFLGKSPMSAPVLADLGTHKIRVKKASFDDFEQPVNAGGDAVTVLVTLAKTLHEGRVVIKAGSNDAIAIDGKVVGQGTYSAKLPSGSHVLRVSAPDMRPYQGDIVVVDNETREVPVTLDRAETKVIVPTWIWYTVAGVVLAGAATTIILVATQGHDSVYKGPDGSLGNVDLSRPPLGLRF